MDIFKCVETSARNNAHCSEENISTHKDFVRSFFESAVHVICGEYNEQTDRCDRYTRGQLEVEKPLTFKLKVDSKEEEEDSVTNFSGSYQRPASYFGPLVHNLAHL